MTSIILLNAVFLAAGLCLLWGLGATRGLRETVELLGLGLLLGAAAVVLLTLQLAIFGIALAASFLFSLLIIGAVGGGLRFFMSVAPVDRARFLSAVSLLAVLFVVPTAAVLYLLVRVAPELGVWEPDAVSTWTYRAKSLYLFRGLDAQSLHSGGAFAYPLYESMLQALDFLVLGRADDLTLHVQFVILLVAFVGAVAGLARRFGASPLAIWPILGLFVLTPEVQARALSPLADMTLDYFFGIGGLLLLLWLETGSGWLLVCGAIPLAAAVSTKREGLLLALAVCISSAICQLDRPRRLVAALAVAVAAVATFAPWRVWVAVHDSASDIGNLSPSSLAPRGAALGPAVRLLAERAFSYDAWLITLPLGLAVAVACLMSGGTSRRIALFYLLLSGLTFAGFLAIWWLVPDLHTAANQEQPAVRLVGALIVLTVAVFPILASRVLWTARAPTASPAHRHAAVGSGEGSRSE